MKILTYRNLTALVFFAGLIVLFFGSYLRYYPVSASLFSKERILVLSLLILLATSLFLMIYPSKEKIRECSSIFQLFILASSGYLLLILIVKIILQDYSLFNQIVNLPFLNFQALGLALMVIGINAFRKYRRYKRLAQNEGAVGQKEPTEKNHE